MIITFRSKTKIKVLLAIAIHRWKKKRYNFNVTRIIPQVRRSFV